MKLRLITPERTLFEGDVESVEGRAPGGDFEILEGHGAWLSPLAICTLTARVSGGPDSAASLSAAAQAGDVGSATGGGVRKVFAVHGGLIEVLADSILVLGDIAEAAEDIDRARAERALSLAKEKIAVGVKEGGEAYELARRAMARAEARLEALTVKR
ncbi:MAG: F0F1 ATP synthase subunit epsilon [Planctomycetota bacterium]